MTATGTPPDLSGVSEGDRSRHTENATAEGELQAAVPRGCKRTPSDPVRLWRSRKHHDPAGSSPFSADTFADGIHAGFRAITAA